MSEAVQSLRLDREELISRLKALGVEAVRWSNIRCPFHDDKNPSASVYQDKQGVWRFKCFVCDINLDCIDLEARLQRTSPAEVLRSVGGNGQAAKRQPTLYESIESACKSIRGEVESVYKYTKPGAATPELVVVRYQPPEGGKRFSQLTPRANGWVKVSLPPPRPIYNRTRVQAAKTVVVVEGEKCVHALQQRNITATTAPGGASAADAADWGPLAGKDCILWPDNDEPGSKYMLQVSEKLLALDPPAAVRMLDPADLGLTEKGADSADLCEARPGDAVRVIKQALGRARALDGASTLEGFLRDVASGKAESISWPWPMLTLYTEAMLPGTVTVCCGSPGASKSFMALESFAYWQAQGVKVSMRCLEDPLEAHQQRILAQQDGQGGLTNLKWIKANAEEAAAALARHRKTITDLTQRLTVDGSDAPTLSEVAEWIEARCEAGDRIIIVDPVTAAKQERRDIWVEHGEFLMRAKRAIERTGTSLYLVTHPKKGGSQGFGLDDIAGGAAWVRFSHCVLWLQFRAEVESRQCVTLEGMKTDLEGDRLMHICKARHAMGTGRCLLYRFEAQTLRLAEQGVIVKRKKERSDEV